MNEYDRFKETYITECFELLDTMEQQLLNINIDAVNLEDINAIFRCAHSIKGGAGAFGFDEVIKFTHVLETLLDYMREGEIEVHENNVDILLRSADILKQMITSINNGASIEKNFGDDVVKELTDVVSVKDKNFTLDKKESQLNNVINASNADSNFEEINIYYVDFIPNENMFNSGNEPLLLLRELKNLGDCIIQANIEKIPEITSFDPDKAYIKWNIELDSLHSADKIKEVFEFVEDDCELKITQVGGYIKPKKPSSNQEKEDIKTKITSSPKEKDEDVKAEIPVNTPEKKATAAHPTTTNTNTNATTSIRVDVEKIDKLVNMVGELVITQAMIQAQSKNLSYDIHSGLLRGIEELSQHTRELQEAIMSVRMQPIKLIFSRMPRIVRDLSKQLNKDIILEMVGENTEIDKTVIEQLSDPLTHMIRNSVDHGISTPEDRLKKGKPAHGTITLAASHSSGRILIEISDDGEGINRERVLKKAIEKELVPANATLSNEEIDNLIFNPGFSTAEVVTNVSGRGVGMDVVKKNILSLGGSVEVKNKPGEGSHFIVSLPLTLAILDGMIVRAGIEHYIIPINNIIETLRPVKEEVRQIAGANDLVNVRGEFLPLIYLNRIFNIKNSIQDATQALVVLVEASKEKFGIVVDELIGQQQVVIKSLEENSERVKGISGATILGDGKISLIIDTLGIHTMGRKDVKNLEIV